MLYMKIVNEKIWMEITEAKNAYQGYNLKWFHSILSCNSLII